jgi:hypothetical protein
MLPANVLNISVAFPKQSLGTSTDPCLLGWELEPPALICGLIGDVGQGNVSCLRAPKPLR